MEDLKEMVAQLLEAARKLPAGKMRHEALKEIGRLRIRLDALAERLTRPPPGK
jgi:hypothetical protein